MPRASAREVARWQGRTGVGSCGAGVIGIGSLLAAGALLSATPAAAQQPPAVSPAATELARLVAPPSINPLEWGVLGLVAQRVPNEARAKLVYRQDGDGAICEPKDDRCIGIAEEIAGRALQAEAAAASALSRQLYANHFQTSLSEPEIAAALAFAKTPGGSRFLQSWASFVPNLFREPVDPRVQQIAAQHRFSWEPYWREYRERTRDLPRRQMPRAVAPPPAPRPQP